ncbi:MAG: phage portal protein [Actinomycetia bacterium]|nr:phage portal protein [Actinomycetes bacterium]
MTLTGAATLGTIAGLDDDERATLDELVKCWTAKIRRNLIRNQYYDQRNVLKDLQIAIPPHLTDIEMVLGWPAKAVDVLARRCKLEEFTFPSNDDDPLGVRELLDSNDLFMELPQTLTSAFVHSCAFVMVTKGDVSQGDPEVLISSQSALYGSGLWDFRRRRLRAAFSVVDMDDSGRVTEFVMFLPKVTIRGRWDQRWVVERYPHTLDRLPVEVLPYKPRLDRPFGCSRISRAVMALSDSALRTMVRSEVHAEFFSAPQRYAMGADETMFQDGDGNTISQWEAIIGRVWAAPRDEDGNAPQLGQFPQLIGGGPHTEQIRMLASLFAGETGLPLSAMGIIHDNPASAEAIEAAERDLIIESKYAMDCFGPRLARVMRTAVEVRDGSVPDGISGLAARWSPPENTPMSAATDAVTKLVAAVPWLGETPLPFEDLDWDDAKIQRALTYKRKAGASMLMAALTRQAADGSEGDTAPDSANPGQQSRAATTA